MIKQTNQYNLYISLFYLLAILAHSTWLTIDAAKSAGFRDPNTNYGYRVIQHNQTIIKVTGIKLTEFGQPNGEPELIQTIKFFPALIDFDLDCSPTHCYLVGVTSKPERNVELYAWQRTQFDLLVKRDSFATPTSVELFHIDSSFYIAVAQEQNQLDLSRLRSGHEGGEPTRFIGNAVYKFTKGSEKNIKYHQFIPLNYDPTKVVYYTGVQQFPDKINGTSHLLVFTNTITNLQSAFIWSPINDQFWPYQIPKPAIISGPEATIPKITVNWESPNVEACFYQLERLISDRDLIARQLIESSQHIWRNNMAMTNVTARVIVHGNVIVRGSVIETPRMTMIGANSRPNITHVNSFVDQHSPSKVEDKVNKAFYKLQFVREKLSRAVPADVPPETLVSLNSPVRFFAPVTASTVIFKNHGIVNSNVRINGIPFRQLEHELISLWGSQSVPSNVVFAGSVVADTLEIHGLVNNAYFMRDAIDIASPFVQVIDQKPSYPAGPVVEFLSVSTPDLILSENATINTIRLSEFVTRDPQTQVITGRKSFKDISMAHLDLANRNILLNGFNLTRLINNALPLRELGLKLFNGVNQQFLRPIKVDNLITNEYINRHINMSSLIYDSVKVEDLGQVQHITGHKRFMEGLKINHLTTDGTINNIQISEIFNLNSAPPIADYRRYLNKTTYSNNTAGNRISGKFIFPTPSVINKNLNVQLVNHVDLSQQAVRRFPASNMSKESLPPQIITGKKTFARPIRADHIRLVNEVELNKVYGTNVMNRLPPPTINGFDIRLINLGIERQLKNPSPIFIGNLEIEGNIFLETNSFNNTGPPRSSLGNSSYCPLNAISRNLVLGGGETQSIETPLRVQTLRAQSAHFGPQGFNGFTFPRDFVLKSLPKINIEPLLEPVYGNKFFDQLIIAPAFHMPYSRANYASLFSPNIIQSKVIIGPRTSINNISYQELQTFIAQERQRNSTGETVLQTLTIYGNLNAKSVNGMDWPEDIILKNLASIPGPSPVPNLQRRIYSPLVFARPSDLVVENQLGLRGPIQLIGRLNGVNVTQFAQQSVTYGDKDLLSVAKPLRNKIFAGGLTINGEMRSQGSLNGINFEELKSRAVLIRPLGGKTVVMAPKSFSSDVRLLGPATIITLNNLPLYRFLKRNDQYTSLANQITISGKKTISGQLKVGRSLIVDGLINGINFTQVKGNAIILGPTNNNLQFNKTLTVEGDIFVDNLHIDPKNGIIDGVRLGDMVPLGARRPIAINYESSPPLPIQHPIPFRETRGSHGIITGFIEVWLVKDLSHLRLPQRPYVRESFNIRGFHQLDQTDFQFGHTTYNLKVGFSDQGLTSVYFTLSGRGLEQLVLPVSSPRSAIFMDVAQRLLFLLISENMDNPVNQCSTGFLSRFHVYIFQPLHNSSSLQSAYFDLYQTIDIPHVDNFEQFEYRGESYVVASSTVTGRVYILLMRGYSGFEIVSYFDAVNMEKIKLMFSVDDDKPYIIIHLINGDYRLMEPVII